ncbi:MAG TPA: hypothetical protein VE913_22505 [Longimicrobium sp.]|nr:hypothetical protein [Longimicrobium sp.]
MRRKVVPLVLLSLISVGAGEASAQAPSAAGPLPWDLPTAAGLARLEQAGFRRDTSDRSRYVSNSESEMRRIAADSSEMLYTRASPTLKETVLLRTRAGRTVQMFYSALGDSASLQMKADEAAADAGRKLGPDTRRGIVRFWQSGDGQRFSAPARPLRLPDSQYQLTILYYRP